MPSNKVVTKNYHILLSLFFVFSGLWFTIMAAINARNCKHTHRQRSTFSTYGLWCDIKFCHQWDLLFFWDVISYDRGICAWCFKPMWWSHLHGSQVHGVSADIVRVLNVWSVWPWSVPAFYAIISGSPTGYFLYACYLTILSIGKTIWGSVTDKWMITEQWWKDTERGKP
jgi:hypothetical protein